MQLFPGVAVYVAYGLNLLLTFLIITLLFGIIFKVLPDAKIKWRDVLTGAITTALLFMLGKFGISFYLGARNIGNTYGAAGSIILYCYGCIIQPSFYISVLHLQKIMHNLKAGEFIQMIMQCGRKISKKKNRLFTRSTFCRYSTIKNLEPFKLFVLFYVIGFRMRFKLRCVTPLYCSFYSSFGS